MRQHIDWEFKSVHLNTRLFVSFFFFIFSFFFGWPQHHISSQHTRYPYTTYYNSYENFTHLITRCSIKKNVRDQFFFQHLVKKFVTSVLRFHRIDFLISSSSSRNSSKQLWYDISVFCVYICHCMRVAVLVFCVESISRRFIRMWYLWMIISDY